MTRRALVESWLRAGLAAVEPELLTRQAVDELTGQTTVIAIGKAAPAMCRGVKRSVGSVSGICVTNHESPVPEGVELVIGDHPIPGERSAEAARRALDLAGEADLALISGGGSALCELPIDGVDAGFVAFVNQVMLERGATIEEMNMVRGHLSLVKGGGLGAIPSYILSDVGAADASIVASGPTFPLCEDPGAAVDLMHRFGVAVPQSVLAALREPRRPRIATPPHKVIADGRTAAHGVVASIPHEVAPVRVRDAWLDGPLEHAVHDLIDTGQMGVTVAAGETTHDVGGSGRGGRNTHAALIAAGLIAGTDVIFATLATDGTDGNSGAAGAIVDGRSINRGGNPGKAMETFDSATYLEEAGDLLVTGPTGTNVADLWLVWSPS